VLLLAAVAFLIIHVVIPSRLETATGGAGALLAGFASRHPLAVGLITFVILAEVIRYWVRWWRGDGDVAAAPVVLSRRLVAQLAAAALAAFLLRASIAETFSVSGPSMLPTLLPNDTLLVDRMAYGFKIPFSSVRLGQKPPARGDLVVFRATEVAGADGPQMVVKRVIGIPGDTVAIRGGDVIVNGWTVPSCDAGPFVSLLPKHNVGGRLTVESLGNQTYLAVRKPLDTDFPEYLVKPGEIFVLGDNRGISSDSHIWTAATGRGVPIAVLEGKVTRIAVGAAADGGMDLTRLFATPGGDLKVRLPGVDMTQTKDRIDACLRARPAVLSPPPPRGGRP
jgi:signal peptidase I